ncbi:hypothetical protein [Trichocoleus desertorum]
MAANSPSPHFLHRFYWLAIANLPSNLMELLQALGLGDGSCFVC